MGIRTGIGWTDHTWNPWRGCHKVSQGCKNCYMFREQRMYGHDPEVVIRAAPMTFNAPLKWARDLKKVDPFGVGHKLVFTCSWSDWCIEEADACRDEAWEIIQRTPKLVYQILTKRVERLAKCLPDEWGKGWENVWLGVSAENQATAEERIPLLLEVPAAIHFLSCEPLLEEVNLRLAPSDTILDWVICGGESGPECRPMSLEWARSLRDQCQAAKIPFYFKQMGGWPDKGTDPEAWPEDLRVQDFPLTTGKEGV